MHDSARGAGKQRGGDDSSRQRKGENSAELIVRLVGEAGGELFRSPGGDPVAYATVRVDQHRETMKVDSPQFETFLARLHYVATKQVAKKEAITDAVNTLRGKALFDGLEYPVAVRVAGHEGAIYLDLADEEWRAVRIEDDWCVVSDPPVRFIRPRGILALPIPVRGGDVYELRQYVNVAHDDDFVLLVSWLVFAVRPAGPYPLLAIYGEQGSAKSTTTRILRELIDPNKCPLRSAPSETRDLMIAASNGWIVALENLSKIRPDLSDALCCLATGASYSTRRLYTDGEEMLFEAQRPIVLNGIVDVVTRPDLADRTVAITLPTILEKNRRPEQDFWSEFREARPRILGAILDGVVAARARELTVQLPGYPRMADFARWATAAEPALGFPDGTFMEAYDRNRVYLDQTALDAVPYYAGLLEVLEDRMGHFDGTASELLELLSNRQEGGDWSAPRTANALSGSLRRIAPMLRRVGIEVEFPPRESNRRSIVIRRRDGGSSSSS